MGEYSMDFIKRHETIDDICFICCDNMPYMREMDMGFWHLSVVDPPYGYGADTMNMGTTAAQRSAMKLKRGKFQKKSAWDSGIPSREYFDQLRRVSRNQIIWGGNYFLDHLSSTDCILVWDKEQGENLTFDDFELAWTSLKIKSMICRRSRVKDAKHEKIHQTQKPVYLYRWTFQKMFQFGIIKKGQRILDTHGGSHNIAIAAREYGLHLTILEKEIEHHLNGIANYRKYTKQGFLSYDS